ncbi:MAG: hypothetical protein Q9225_001966 [Loekoesia sp. 1 TL-2023]
METVKKQESNTAINWDEQRSSSSISSTEHLFRSHPNVTNFAPKTATHTHSLQATQIRPIDLFPTNVSENQFASLRSDFWIIGSQDGDVESIDEGFVVVKKDVDEVAISTSGK